MGLTPDGWGPYLWATIHLTALGSPDTFDDIQASAYRSFYNSLPTIMPCASCADHLRKNLTTIPLDDSVLKGRESLFEWTVKLHNTVNTMLGKPIAELEESRKFWNSVADGHHRPFTQKQNNSFNIKEYSKIIWVILFAIILLGIWILLKSNKEHRNFQRKVR